MNIGGLTIQMAADLAQLRRDMDDAKRMVGDGMADIIKAVDMAKSALGALGVATTLTGFGAMIQKTVDAAAEMYRLSERTGMTVESLSALRGAARMSGTDMGEVASASQKLSRNMVEAQGGTGKAAEAFKALGVSVFDSNGKLKPTEQMMLDVAKATAQFRQGAGLTAAMMDIFGKSGANLLPMLAELAEKGNLNGKVTDEQARQAYEFEKALAKARGTIDGYTRTVALEMLPVITKLPELFGAGAKVAGAYFALFYGAPAIMAVATKAFDAFALAVVEQRTVMEAMNASWLATRGSMSAIITEFGYLKTAGSLAIALFAGWEIGTWLRDNFQVAQMAGISFVEIMMVGWEKLKYAGEYAWLKIQQGMEAVNNAMLSGMAAAVEAVSSGLRALGADKASADLAGFASALRTTANAGNTYDQQLVQLNKQHETTVAGIKKITKEMADDAYAHFNTAAAVKQGTKEYQGHAEKVAATSTEYDSLIKKLNEKLAADQQAVYGGTKLTESQRQALAIMVQLRDGTLKLTDAQKLQVASRLEQIGVLEQVMGIQAEETKLQADMLKDRQQALEALGKETLSLQDARDKQRDQNLELALGKDAYEALQIARMRDRADQLEAIAATSDQSDELRKQAALLRERAALAGEGVVLKEAQATAAEWKKTTDSIFNGLTDALMRAFESGKGFGQAFLDTLKNAFKTLVLKPTIEAVLTPVAASIGSLMGAGNAVAGTSGAAGGAGSLGNLGSLASLASTFSTFGSFGATGVMSTLTGTSLGTSLGAAGSLIEGGSVAGGLGMGIGAVAPYALAAIAAYKLLTADHNAHQGYGSTTGSRLFGFGYGTDDGQQATLQQLAQSVMAGTSGTAAALGGKLGAGLNVQAASDIDLNGHGSGSIAFVRSGQVVGGVQTGGNSFASAATKLADANTLPDWFSTHTSAAIVAGLQQSDLPARFKEYFSSVSAYSLSQADADKMLAAASATKQMTDALGPLGGVFSRLGSLSVDAASSLATLTGGLDQLLAKAKGYVQNYYSQSEQMGISAANVLGTLKAAGIDFSTATSRQDLRTLMDSLHPADATERTQMAALLNVSGDYAQLADYLQAQGLNLGQLAAQSPGFALAQGQGATTADMVAAQDASNAALASIASASAATSTAIGQLIALQQDANQRIVAQLTVVANNTAGSARGSTLADLASTGVNDNADAYHS